MYWNLNPSQFLMWAYSDKGSMAMDRLCCCSYIDAQACGEVETYDYYYFTSRKPTTVPTEWIDQELHEDNEKSTKADKDNDSNNKTSSPMELLSRPLSLAAVATRSISDCLKSGSSDNDKQEKTSSSDQPQHSSSPDSDVRVNSSSSFGSMTTISIDTSNNTNSTSNQENTSYGSQSTCTVNNTSTTKQHQRQQRQQHDFHLQRLDYEQREIGEAPTEEETVFDDDTSATYCSSSTSYQCGESKCNSSSPIKLIDMFLLHSRQRNRNKKTKNILKKMKKKNHDLELVDLTSKAPSAPPKHRHPTLPFSKRFASSAFHDDVSNLVQKQKRYRRNNYQQQQKQRQTDDEQDQQVVFNKMLRHIQAEGLVQLPHLRNSSMRYEC